MAKKALKLTGWIEVHNIRPEQPGRWLLNLDHVSKIHFDEEQGGVAALYFGNGLPSESLNEANCRALQAAIEAAKSES